MSINGPENLGPHGRKLNDAIKAFQDAQDKYSEYGAYDTEPRCVFADLLENAVEGREVIVPRSGDGWQLYTASMKCGIAARGLHSAAKKAVDAIKGAPVNSLGELKKVVEWWYG